MKRIALLFPICLLLVSYGAFSKDSQTTQAQQIQAAINRLLERHNDDAFVIVTNKRTGKFLQFSGGASQDLIFDLPGQTLNPEEITRAKDLLKTFDIIFDEWDVYDKPAGKVVGRQSGFSKNLGRDSDLAAHIAWKVLTEVYSPKQPLELLIEEN